MAYQYWRQARSGRYRARLTYLLRTLGRTLKSIAAAGVNPADIDAVFISHIHPDHAAGLLTLDKKMAFPNATVHVDADEYMVD